MGDHPNDGNVLCPPWWSRGSHSILLAIYDDDIYDVLSTTVMYEGWCDVT